MRFLLVDDSSTMRRIYVNVLGRLGYPQVVEASDGLEALSLLAKQPVDMIITDWNMPKMNGLEFVKSIRALPSGQDVPILMITSAGSKGDIARALESGVNDYLVKPFTPELIKEKIERIASTAA